VTGELRLLLPFAKTKCLVSGMKNYGLHVGFMSKTVNINIYDRQFFYHDLFPSSEIPGVRTIPNHAVLYPRISRGIIFKRLPAYGT